MAQSRTAVNAKASGAEPMKKLTDTGAVPAGGETQQVGGPTPENYKSDDESAKLSANAPGQSKTAVNSKAASAGDMSAQPTVSPSVVPGGGSTDGTNSGRGAGGDPQPTVGKEASYEHVQIDRNAAAHLDELAEGQDASDEFKMKAKVIFEGALNQKLQLEVSRLEEEFSTRFEQEITDIAEKVEAFLNYTSQAWLEENKLVVENGIRNELSESFMGGLKSLFEDHYVSLPDEKYDIFESMVAKLDDMEDKLNEQIEANVSLSSSMSGFQRQKAIADVSWDLSETAKEKLAGLAENVEFESDENYRQKLSILKESFVESPVGESTEVLSESADALAPTAEEGYTPSMAAYARALGRSLR
jgi:hypothetical protein